MQQAALTSAALVSTRLVNAKGKNDGTEDSGTADKPFNLNYAIHDGMFSNHAGKDFIEQIKFARERGFSQRVSNIQIRVYFANIYVIL